MNENQVKQIDKCRELLLNSMDVDSVCQILYAKNHIAQR